LKKKIKRKSKNKKQKQTKGQQTTSNLVAATADCAIDW
jgi:hypothetical protein